jgi:biotin transport system substrate-specific component
MYSISLPGLNTSRTAAVDALRRDDASVMTQVLGVVTFALLTALGAQVRLYLWEVPFTLQTLAVYGSGLYLGWRNGMLAQIAYLALGLVAPVYAGGEYGPAYLFGAVTAGYIFGFPVAAAVSGLVSRRWNSLTGSVLSLAVASLMLFALGVTWLHYAAGHTSWIDSIDRGWLRFVVVDLAKIILVSLVYSGSRSIRRS